MVDSLTQKITDLEASLEKINTEKCDLEVALEKQKSEYADLEKINDGLRNTPP